MEMGRVDKHNYYLDIAEAVSERGTCLMRKFGAVIVNNDEVVSTGYVGAPRGRRNCIDLGVCIRKESKVPRGTHYELCRSVHAEQNAMLSASRDKMCGATLYLVGIECATGEYVKNARPCTLCERMIVNAGIARVVVRVSETEFIEISVMSEYVLGDPSLTGGSLYTAGENKQDADNCEEQLSFNLEGEDLDELVIPQF